ncbi:UPF0149 family protein [Parahaliea mediterranea]|uniref:UPF0149 family protein n=1 Tax=Parahaliea mediterranea TaxID=651086 RepID=A0A939IMI8_9GAMM|nr:UPF0149 family protein [Parahaliea mediterranea]MBN7797057.1 UPF0149 family protein [Parahaliea mediterranea]
MARASAVELSPMFDDMPGAGTVFDFDEIAGHLVEQGEQTSPSELHGCLSGLLSAGAVGEPAAGLAGLNQTLELDLHGELAELMLQLYSVTQAALQDEEFDFHPLLPDDDTELDVRIMALGFWCRGFMAGFARATAVAGRGDRSLPGDSAEILRDIAMMAQAGADEDAEVSEDESEGHYAELVEYLRFAVLNVFMDSQGRADDAPGEPPLH